MTGGMDIKGRRIGTLDYAAYASSVIPLEATVAALGKTLLPIMVADRDARLRRLDLSHNRPCPSREIWLLAHADQLDLARVRAVIEWVERLTGCGRK